MKFLFPNFEAKTFWLIPSSAPSSQRCLLFSAGVPRETHAQFGHHVPDGARVRRLDVPPVRMSVLLTQTPHVALHRQGPGLPGERERETER